MTDLSVARFVYSSLLALSLWADGRLGASIARADEVKALAAQTARAMAKISRQIEAIRSETVAVVGAVQDVTAVIGQVHAVAAGIAAAVEQQAAAACDIAGSVQAVTTATKVAVRSMEGFPACPMTPTPVAERCLLTLMRWATLLGYCGRRWTSFCCPSPTTAKKTDAVMDGFLGAATWRNCAWTTDAGTDIEMDMSGQPTYYMAALCAVTLACLQCCFGKIPPLRHRLIRC